jgi:hypothetical protein
MAPQAHRQHEYHIDFARARLAQYEFAARAEGLSACERSVLFALICFRGPKGLFPSYTARASVSRRTAIRGVARLRALGMVVTHLRRGRTNNYSLACGAERATRHQLPEPRRHRSGVTTTPRSEIKSKHTVVTTSLKVPMASGWLPGVRVREALLAAGYTELTLDRCLGEMIPHFVASCQERTPQEWGEAFVRWVRTNRDTAPRSAGEQDETTAYRPVSAVLAPFRRGGQ